MSGFAAALERRQLERKHAAAQVRSPKPQSRPPVLSRPYDPARDGWNIHKIDLVNHAQQIYRDDTRGDGADLLFQN